MYALYTTTEAGPSTIGTLIRQPGLSDLMDKYLVHLRNAKDLRPGTTVTLSNSLGRTLRTFSVAKVEEAPAKVKLSEAMQKALDSVTTNSLIGAPNTLKALAKKGLVQHHGDRYSLTDLGRQYRRV
jgi:hypothetical protein